MFESTALPGLSALLQWPIRRWLRAVRSGMICVGAMVCSVHLTHAAEICIGYMFSSGGEVIQLGGQKIESDGVFSGSRTPLTWEERMTPTSQGGGDGTALFLGMYTYPIATSHTYRFTPPLEGASIKSVGSNCGWYDEPSSCETYSVDINGSHHAFTTADISPLPRLLKDPSNSVPIELGVTSNGDIRGLFMSNEGSGWGAGMVRVDAAPISTLRISHTAPINVGLWGIHFNLCFQAPSLRLELKKEASAARWIAGQSANYTLSLNSNGVPTTAETTITDDVPSSLTIGALPAGCTGTGQVVACKVPAGLTTSMSFVIPVTPKASAFPSVENTARASGGGDAACNGTGACESKVTTPVALPSTITTKKSASASPLIAGAPDQFYAIAITVADATTTAPIAWTDTLPNGIVLSGPPTVRSGTTTASLSGCPASGGSGGTLQCSLAAGIGPGTFEILIPINATRGATGLNTGTNTVNLNGGGDPACTAALGEACDASTPDTSVVPTKLKLEKTASASRFIVGVPASYTLKLSSNGGLTTTEAVITDAVPPSLRIGTPPAGCTVAGQDVTCRVPPGMTTFQSFVIPVTPLAPASGITNIAEASGGGDGSCAGTGDCVSAVTTAVTLPLAITSTKTASANPLLVGTPGQFYRVAVQVANLPTTAPLAIEDMLPTGITLAGPPILFPGTTSGSLSGCTTVGSLVTGCRVASGVAPGTFEIRIPVNVEVTAVGVQAGTNTVNLQGGGDSLCTALLDEPCDATTPPTGVRPADPRVRILKEVTGGSGTHRFLFALSGLSVASETITVTDVGVEVGALNITGTAGVAASISEVSPAGWPRNPVNAFCFDGSEVIAPAPAPTRQAARAMAAGGPIVLTGNTLTIPADRMVPGADLYCVFVNNDAFVITGRVFDDNGSGAGKPNDGLVNGAEKGMAGVQMRLSDCAAGVFSTAMTDGLGRYRLEVPSATAIDDPVCVEELTPASHLSTGASVGSTQLPSGVAVDQNGKTYTYLRTADSTPDRIAFRWNNSSAGDLNFGDVALNRFGADSARSGSPGSSVSHSHTFVAQTGGAVSFDTAGAVATPPIDGWSAKVYADPGCTGALQGGAAVLYPPSVPVPVTAGQNVCVVVQEFIPAQALVGHSDKRTVQASFVFTNASPGLSASYLVNDTTTVSSTALELKKEVRNLSKSGSTFGLINEAKSGETLEYRITYINNGATPISDLTVNDTTPVYTSFAGSQTGTTPATLTACAKNTPANALPAPAVACAATQAAGGAGPLAWKFTGQLAPGGTGVVLFSVTVN
ncbi:hypothetical protein [Variovorax paradoxus]|uniref:prealbumin-like fold domain-containing protein n=1 Tax=Variovorax paradoxus TaxID=34073 RepID=UPI001884EC16|nr:hypothetical protein [Variovorax paradoxus]